jgi:hypothetical protein
VRGPPSHSPAAACTALKGLLMGLDGEMARGWCRIVACHSQTLLVPLKTLSMVPGLTVKTVEWLIARKVESPSGIRIND